METVPEGLAWVSGAAAAAGGALESLAGGFVPPEPGESGLGAGLAVLDDAVAASGWAGDRGRAWVLPASAMLWGGTTADALATVDLDAAPPLSSAGDLDGDGQDELVVAEAGRLLVFSSSLRGEASADDAWATLEGAPEGELVGLPIPAPGGLLVARATADGLMLSPELGLGPGPRAVSGGVLLPAGALEVSAVGDVDGDGVRDLWVAGEGRGWVAGGAPAALGQLVVLAEVSAAGVPALVDVGDADGDGLDDGALLDVGPDGDARLGPLAGEGVDIGAALSIAAADLDGDGVKEVIVACPDRFDLVSAASLSEPGWDGRGSAQLSGGSLPGTLRPAGDLDLDGDGAHDLLWAR